MRRTTAIATTLGLIGGGWGLAAAAVALPAAALAGAAIAWRRPGVACALLYLAGCAGVLLAGAAWLGPAAAALTAAVILLVAVPSPFAAEIARERGEGGP